MKVYIAGKLSDKSEREFLEEVAKLCEDLGFETYLPHRDGGLCKGMKDVDRIFELDINKGFEDCGLIVAVLDGLHVGAGTAWELGYAYGKNIPAIGIKRDESVAEALDYLSPILIGSMKIIDSIDKLKKELVKFNQGA